MPECTKCAGIGARATPPDVLQQMEQIGMMLAVRGVLLRSGGADGADSAFARGAGVINKNLMTIFPGHIGHYLAWQEHAARYHPNWAACNEFARKLHARNSAIMLGSAPITAPDPVAFVVCWTPGGKITGGTGQALRIAADLSIPVFNLAVTPVAALWEWLDA